MIAALFLTVKFDIGQVIYFIFLSPCTSGDVARRQNRAFATPLLWLKPLIILVNLTKGKSVDVLELALQDWLNYA
jgi:hypothetical protein